MLHLNVKSLFTNVPIEAALSRLKTRLREFHFSCFEVKDFINLTQFCIAQTAFNFDKRFLKKSEGLSISNPLSPIFCDINMHYFVEKLLNLNFKFWMSYVDDTFVFVGYNSDFSIILQTVISIDPNIQFTFKLEKCDKLPFLDVSVTNRDSTVMV